jgi:DNA polymerase-4
MFRIIFHLDMDAFYASVEQRDDPNLRGNLEWRPIVKNRIKSWESSPALERYNADPATMPAALKERDMAPRQRRPLRDFVFAGHWKQPSPLVLNSQA